MTGRPETRRTLLEWVEVMLSGLALTALAVAVLLMTCTLVLRAFDTRLAPPGERFWVDDGKYQIHLYCHGNKTDEFGKTTTTVLIEGGEDPVERGLWQFAEHALNNGSISRFCFADRPGYAWVSLRVCSRFQGQDIDGSTERQRSVAAVSQHGVRRPPADALPRRRTRPLDPRQRRSRVPLLPRL